MMFVPIVSGMPSLGDDAVVAVVQRRPSCDEPPLAVTCSGVLVGPRLVVTAAHCIERARPDTIEVFVGHDVQGDGTFLGVSALRTDPGYDPMTGEHDIALVFLAEPSSVAPYALPTIALDTLAPGTPLRAVGFGVTARLAQDAGIKREGTLALGAVRAGSFDATPAPSLTCDIDSGGPLFAMLDGVEQLVGITVSGDVACETTAFQVRVDAVAAYIAPAIDAANNAPVVTRCEDSGGCNAAGRSPLPVAVLLAQLGLLELARRRARNRVDKIERVR